MFSIEANSNLSDSDMFLFQKQVVSCKILDRLHLMRIRLGFDSKALLQVELLLHAVVLLSCHHGNCRDAEPDKVVSFGITTGQLAC